MLDPRSEIYPTIEYRPIQPSDLEALEKIHVALFPIRYLLDANASYARCSSLNERCTSPSTASLLVLILWHLDEFTCTEHLII
jgi:hypothetical protein